MEQRRVDKGLSRVAGVANCINLANPTPSSFFLGNFILSQRSSEEKKGKFKYNYSPMVSRQVCEHPPLLTEQRSISSQLWPSLASLVPSKLPHAHS